MIEEEKIIISEVDHLIDHLYDVSLDPDLWPIIFDSLSEILNANNLFWDDDISLIKPNNILYSHIAPHLRRAISLREKYNDLEEKSDLFSSIFDNIPIGFVLIASNREIFLANILAKELIKENKDVISAENDIFTIKDKKVNTQFISMISSLNTIDKEGFHNSHTLTLPSKNDSVSILLTNFLEGDKKDLLSKNCVAMLITPSNIQQKISPVALQSLFGLSNAEAKLVKQLANGSNIEEIADACHISKHTVRTQLKSIFSKTNTSRQPELVKLILTSPAVYIPYQQNDDSLSHAAEKVAFDYHNPKYNQTLKLSDGRVLGFAEYGPENGMPLFFFHSIELCRFDRPIDLTLLDELNIRFIVPERAGAGLSTPLEEYVSPEYFLNDFLELTNHLQIHEYAIMGHSIGSLYAAMCAATFPDKIRSVSLVSSVPNLIVKSDISYLGAVNRIFMIIAQHTPRLSRYLINNIMSKATSDPDAFIKNIPMSIHDKELFSENEFRSFYASGLLKAGENHNYKCTIEEIILCSRPWPIDYKDIGIEFDVWHGEEDKHTPFNLLSKTFDQIENCRKHYIKDKGHFFIHDYWREVLSSAIK